MTMIKEIFQKVERIVIEYQITHVSAFEKKTESGRAEYKPDFAAEFAFCCINDTCTGNGFDLYPIVSLMAAKGETDSKGSVKCEGEESRKGHFACDTTLSYSVHLEYQKGSRR